MNTNHNLPPNCSSRDIDATCQDQGYNCAQCDRRVDELDWNEDKLCPQCAYEVEMERDAEHALWVLNKQALGWAWNGDRWVPPVAAFRAVD